MFKHFWNPSYHSSLYMNVLITTHTQTKHFGNTFIFSAGFVLYIQMYMVCKLLVCYQWFVFIWNNNQFQYNGKLWKLTFYFCTWHIPVLNHFLQERTCLSNFPREKNDLVRLEIRSSVKLQWFVVHTVVPRLVSLTLHGFESS